MNGDEKKKSVFNNACRFIGLFNEKKEEWEAFKKTKVKISEEQILKEIANRSKAKKNGNFDLADKIRKELFEQGIVIEDQKDKTVWKLK